MAELEDTNMFEAFYRFDRAKQVCLVIILIRPTIDSKMLDVWAGLEKFIQEYEPNEEYVRSYSSYPIFMVGLVQVFIDDPLYGKFNIVFCIDSEFKDLKYPFSFLCSGLINLRFCIQHTDFVGCNSLIHCARVNYKAMDCKSLIV